MKASARFDCDLDSFGHGEAAGAFRAVECVNLICPLSLLLELQKLSF